MHSYAVLPMATLWMYTHSSTLIELFRFCFTWVSFQLTGLGWDLPCTAWKDNLWNLHRCVLSDSLVDQQANGQADTQTQGNVSLYLETHADTTIQPNLHPCVQICKHILAQMRYTHITYQTCRFTLMHIYWCIETGLHHRAYLSCCWTTPCMLHSPTSCKMSQCCENICKKCAAFRNIVNQPCINHWPWISPDCAGFRLGSSSNFVGSTYGYYLPSIN